MPEKNNTMKIVISTAVLLILAAVFIVSIADQTAVNTQKTHIADESFNINTLGCYQNGQVNESLTAACNLTVANAPTSWKQEDCPLTGIVVTNATGTALTLDTDYRVWDSIGIIEMLNTTDTNSTALSTNVTLIDYTYCGDNYVASSWGRSVLGVNVGLYAVAILIAAALVVYLLFGKKEYD